MSIVVMVDGGGNFSKSSMKKYNIDVLPYNIEFSNGDTYRDLVDVKCQKDLVELIQKHNDLPKIHALDSEKVATRLRKHIENGDDVLYITSSSKLTNSYRKALEISKDFDPNTIQVIDSLNIGDGQTLLAIAAREYINNGNGLKQTTKYISKLRHSIMSCYAIGNSNYLYNKQNCQTMNDNYLEFHNDFPIAELNNGKIVLTYSTKDLLLGLQILKNRILDQKNNIETSPVIISYSGDKSVAVRLKEYVKKMLSNDVIVLEHSSVIFVNTGMNTVSLSFIVKR